MLKVIITLNILVNFFNGLTGEGRKFYFPDTHIDIKKMLIVFKTCFPPENTSERVRRKMDDERKKQLKEGHIQSYIGMY